MELGVWKVGVCRWTLVFFILVAVAYVATNSIPLMADDGSTTSSSTTKAETKPDSAKPTSVKPDAPAPGLTERERWLLDRVEQLEHRVAELEAKSAPATAASASTAPVAQPSPGEPAPAAQPGANTAIGSSNAIPAAANAAAPASATATASTVQVSAPSNVAMSASHQVTVENPAKAEPFSFADFTWLNGTPRTKESPIETKFFTPEIRADVDYIYDFNHPKDDTIGGSSEVFRSDEVHVTQLGVGGDFHYDNVRARLMTQFGLYSQTTPRNDASPARGQWNLDNAYRYISEAYGGYHFNALHGINVDAGIFLSYVGLFSYYNFDNWAYQPSYVSSNTPWFFNGVRVQVFPTEHLKIEGWFVNGWQAYGRFNNRPGIGAQILWRPNGSLEILGNQYALGEDALGFPGRVRYHTDDSIQLKYYDNQETFISKAAFSLTGDIGCEHGGGVSCAGGSKKGPKQDFLGFMFYNRFWFSHDLYALTLGGGRINNPGRYLVLLPPINGATAASGTPYFTENPGDPFKAWDASATFDWMPRQYITFRWEFDHRAASVPYFSGPGGITPTNCPTAPIVENICGSPGAFVSGFTPDLKKIENRLDLAILVKF
jgi:Putative beta-barrel porin-2, OmpL-like. bbp2